MNIEPALPRYRLDHDMGGLRVAIPARRNWFIIAFYCLWLVGWALGETTVLAELVKGEHRAPQAFMAVWLAGWTCGGAYVLLTILWQLCGRELLTIAPDALHHRVEIFGIGRTRSYALGQVTRLRAVEFNASIFTSQAAAKPPFFGAPTGPLAFDYGARTIRCAPSLDEAEARLLLAELKEQMPASVF
jgi:hypothetical protein